MHPVQVLMDEHQLILRVLTAMETCIAQSSQSAFPVEFFEQALDFFKNFADGSHHHKEEQSLFPAMHAKGMPMHGGPIAVMLHEHDFGRECLAGIRGNLEGARAGDAQAIAEIRRFGTSYIDMLRQHISKEDNILFQMAARLLTGDDATALAASFELAPNVREQYQALAEELERKVSAPAGVSD